jgi:hypothetical protein
MDDQLEVSIEKPGMDPKFQVGDVIENRLLPEISVECRPDGQAGCGSANQGSGAGIDL